MALRFRRSIRIAPGVTLNLGKKGVSVSAGPKGASVTLGKNGLWGNIGLPGTGLSYRTRLSGSPAQQARLREIQEREARREQLHGGGLAGLSVSLDEKGQLLLADRQGRALTPAEKRQVWDQFGADLEQWLAVEMADINGDTALILNISNDIQAPASAEPKYEAPPFAEAEPVMPPAPTAPVKPVAPELKLGFWESWWPGRVAKRQAAHQAALAAWQQSCERWQHACAEQATAFALAQSEYQSAQARWQQAKQAFAAEQALIAQQFSERLTHDAELVAELLENELASLDWPRETLVSLQLQLSRGRVYLDVDLPEVEDLPSHTATLGANHQRLLIKEKSARQLREEYARHVHGVVLRLAGVVFALLPNIKEVVVSGYSQRLNAGTGHIADEYLLSVLLTQAQYGALNFQQPEQVDPIAALAQGQLVRDMTATGMFNAITPLAPMA